MPLLYESSSSVRVGKVKHEVYKLDEHFDREAFYGQFGRVQPFLKWW